MGRGVIYEFIEGFESKSSSWLCECDLEHLAEIYFDYVRDYTCDEVKQRREELISELEKHQVEIKRYEYDSEERVAIRMNENAKKNLFLADYLLFVELVENLTIDKFVNAEYVWKMRDALESTMGDAMYLDGVYYDSFEEGLREMQVNTWYTIGNILRIH